MSTIASVDIPVNWDFDDDITFSTNSNEDNLSTFTSTVEKSGSKLTRVLITGFPTDDNPKWLNPTTYFDIHQVVTWVAQFEVTPTTNKLHFHAYAEFHRDHRIRFQQLCKVLEDKLGSHPNVRVPKGRSDKQRSCAINYCLKNLDIDGHRKRNTEPFVFSATNEKFEFDKDLFKTPKKMSKKEELAEVQRQWIESKDPTLTWDQIVHENEESKQLFFGAHGPGKSYHEGRMQGCPRRKIKNILVFYGAGGTGKTTLAENWDIQQGEFDGARLYQRNDDDGKFWGGGATAYKGQRIIHLEEFSGASLSVNMFKKVCDINKTGPNVNIKGRGGYLNHDTVIITSNKHPAAWWPNHFTDHPEDFDAVIRRITQVFFFPKHRPDGSLNRPTEGTPPFWIDQTEDITDMYKNGEAQYSDLAEHARTHWYLPNSGAKSPSFNEPSTTDRFHNYCKTGRYN